MFPLRPLRVILLCSLIALSLSRKAVLDEKIIMLAEMSAQMSGLAAWSSTDSFPPEFDEVHMFTAEPDQTIVVKTKGYCFGAFRATSEEERDQYQNIDPRSADVCQRRTRINSDNITTSSRDCCTVRAGFNRGYRTRYRSDFEEALRNCTATCQDPDGCLVLTGWSQGGSIAHIASLYWSDMNPLVFTFSAARAVHKRCPLINSERHYRFVNSIETNIFGLSYDAVAIAPGIGADHFGYLLILSDDRTGILDLGLDSDYCLLPAASGGVHSIDLMRSRIQDVIAEANGTYPIRTTGYASGYPCTRDNECESNTCSRKSLLDPFKAKCD